MEKVLNLMLRLNYNASINVDLGAESFFYSYFQICLFIFFFFDLNPQELNNFKPLESMNINRDQSSNLATSNIQILSYRCELLLQRASSYM